MLSKITVSPAPHISKGMSTRSIMLDVIIALSPAIVAALIFFRLPALVVIGTCVVSCVATEWLCNLILKKNNTIDDLSAVVTGIILAMSLPPAIPWWVCVIGSAFAIAIGKMVFGGLGCNIFNPAMASRAFLTASFGMLMTTWTVPATIGEVTVIDKETKTAVQAVSPVISPTNKYAEDQNIQAITQATPLAWSKQAIKGKAEPPDVNRQLADTFIGNVGGCLGETSAIAILIGLVWMLYRKTIAVHIPLAVVISALAFASVCYFIKPESYVEPIFHITGGGMLFCAIFIATDPVTAPLSTKGMWIFGAGVGLLVMLIRNVGEYPEGIMYAVLIMNAVSPLIDRFCKLTPAGGVSNG